MFVVCTYNIEKAIELVNDFNLILCKFMFSKLIEILSLIH